MSPSTRVPPSLPRLALLLAALLAAGPGAALDLRPEAAGVEVDLLPTVASAAARKAGGALQAWVGSGRSRLRLDVSGQPITLPRPGPPPVFTSEGGVLCEGLEVARLGLVRIDGDLRRISGAVVQPGPSATVTPVDTGVHLGELEGSKISALEALVGLVATQRGFDFSMQAIETYRRMGQGANLGQVR